MEKAFMVLLKARGGGYERQSYSTPTFIICGFTLKFVLRYKNTSKDRKIKFRLYSSTTY